ncbi:MAG TPA: hypothetical protein VIY47_09465 [Ignavibacteriaceae bacterium]
MGKYLVNTESKMEADHFIMLDAINAVSGNEFDRSFPKVQVVNPEGMNSYLDNKANENNPENELTHKEKNTSLLLRSILMRIIKCTIPQLECNVNSIFHIYQITINSNTRL